MAGKRDPNGPTAKIIELARNSPGGVIRWCEAQRTYLEHSHFNNKWPKKMQSGFKMNVKRILDRHFKKVEGTKGYYVLSETVPNAHDNEDVAALQNFVHIFGSDDFGMSTRTLVVVDLPHRHVNVMRMSEVV